MIGATSSRGIAIFLLAFAVRLAWVLLAGGRALEISDDAKAYNDLAVNLVERGRFVTVIDPPHRLDLPYAQRPPLTPFYLAAVYRAFGIRLVVAQLFLSLVAAGAAVLTFMIGTTVFSRGVGVISGGLVAVYPFFVFLSALPLTENLALPLYSSVVLVLVTGAGMWSTLRAIVVGVLLGLTALDRPQVIGMLPFLVILALVGERGRRLWKRFVFIGLTVAVAVAVVSPWLIRNRALIGRWFPISLQGGTALYMGNNPYSGTPIKKLLGGARGWYDDPRMGDSLQGLSPAEADRHAFHLAVDFVRHNPLKAAGFAINKSILFFYSYNDPVAKISWYSLLAISLIGFWLTRSQWQQLLPIYLLILQTLLTAAVFTSMPRFRAPVEPLFLLMAAVAIRR